MRIRWLPYYQMICLLSLFSILAAAFETRSASIVRAHEVQNNQMLKLSVDDPRPLAAAAKLLQDKYGLVITYEDPRLVNEDDLVDQTDPKYRQAHPGGLRALAPKGGHLEISYVVSQVTGKPENPGVLIQMLLDANAAAGNPGRFRLIQAGQFFHIIPAEVKNSGGQWVNQGSILDIPITFPKQERSVYDTLKAITRELRQATQLTGGVGQSPLLKFFERVPTTQGASGEPARDVLVRTLESTGRRFSWSLLYAPTMKWFALNVSSVPN